MEVTENVKTLCAPVVDDMGIELYDVERAGGILRVTIDGPGGVSLDQVAEATRRISRLLDEHDPVPGRYTLEVTSPGLERNLRTPEHFARAVGMQTSVRVRKTEGGAQRVRGTIVGTDGDAVTVAPADGGPDVRLAFADIDRARTVFEWGGAERPGGARRTKKTKTNPGAPAAPAGGADGVCGDGDDNEVSSS
jgi:ribosome maturation factor RimP